LAANHIKILVNTRTENNAFAFKARCTGGIYVKWGKNESAVAVASNTLTERHYDTTQCQKYCVIEIYPQGANPITAFTVQKTFTFVAQQVQFPAYLWIAANYAGIGPDMSIGASGGVSCTKLEAVWMSNITSIPNYAFYYCSALQSVTIPVSVTTLGMTIFNSSSLRSITIPSGVTTVGNSLFSTCTGLETVIFNNSHITSLGTSTFSGSISLQLVVLPTSLTSLGNNTFNNCSSLQYVTIPGGVVTIGSSVFCNCNSLNTVIIPAGVTAMGASCFYQDYSLKKTIFTGTITTATDYGSDMFMYCEQIDTLNWKGVKATRFAFYGYVGKPNKLGSSGHLANDSIPIRIDWANSTFSNSTAPQLDLSYNSLDSLDIHRIFQLLPVVVGKTVKITGNPNPQISAAWRTYVGTKGWTVTP
jgi:hypothetical protein